MINNEAQLAEAKAATERNPASSEAWAAYGEALLAADLPAEAATAYKEANMIKGKQPAVLFGLGKALALTGDNYHAVPHLEESVKLDGKNPEARALLVKELLLRGKELEGQANLWGAEQYYEKAFKFDKKNDEVFEILSRFYTDTGQQTRIGEIAYESGRTSVMPSIQSGATAPTTAVVDHSHDADAAILAGEGSNFLHAGNEALAAQDFPRALEEFKKAASLMAGNVPLSLGLGKAYSGIKDHQHAVHSLQDCLDRDSHHAEARILLKQELIARGHELKAEANLLGAEQYYEKAFHLDRTDLYVLRLLEDYYRMTGQETKINDVRREAGLVNTEELTVQTTSYDDLILPMGTPESGPATPQAKAPAAQFTQAASPLQPPPGTGVAGAPGPAQSAQPAAPTQQQMIPCRSCKKMIMPITVNCPYCGSRQNSSFANVKVETPWHFVAYRIMAVLIILLSVANFLPGLIREGFSAGVVAGIIINGIFILWAVGLLVESDVAQSVGIILCVAGFMLGGLLNIVFGLTMLGGPLAGGGLIMLGIGVLQCCFYGFLGYLIGKVSDSGMV